jgi:hypothetical protein
MFKHERGAPAARVITDVPDKRRRCFEDDL